MWTKYWTKLGASGTSWASELSYNCINTWFPSAAILDIERMFIRDEDTDYPVEKIGWTEYLAIEDKYASSLPTKFVFHKGLSTEVHFDCIPDDSTYTIHYFTVNMLDDMDSSGDAPPFPVKYIEMLTWVLASRLASEKRLTISERQYIDGQADRYWLEVMRDDNERPDEGYVTNAY